MNSYKVHLQISATDRDDGGSSTVWVSKDMIAASEEEIRQLYAPYPNIYEILSITKYEGGTEDGTTDG